MSDPGFNQNKQKGKTNRLVGLSRELRALRSTLLFFILVDFPSREIGKIKRGFRALRSAASLRGWIAPGRGPGPACRLRAGFRLSGQKKRTHYTSSFYFTL
ncbi:hypothetical protein [Butyricicoccus pullicaecorum]|uniref:hypothetical protein n=1 Tax=Butyricicoccus pullicaecorum TaxID=501571 RepID=UPI001177F62B|nr:hypothetical protein [Butyricicoccus pullicaecorum]